MKKGQILPNRPFKSYSPLIYPSQAASREGGTCPFCSDGSDLLVLTVGRPWAESSPGCTAEGKGLLLFASAPRLG